MEDQGQHHRPTAEVRTQADFLAGLVAKHEVQRDLLAEPLIEAHPRRRGGELLGLRPRRLGGGRRGDGQQDGADERRSSAWSWLHPRVGFGPGVLRRTLTGVELVDLAALGQPRLREDGHGAVDRNMGRAGLRVDPAVRVQSIPVALGDLDPLTARVGLQSGAVDRRVDDQTRKRPRLSRRPRRPRTGSSPF